MQKWLYSPRYKREPLHLSCISFGSFLHFHSQDEHNASFYSDKICFPYGLQCKYTIISSYCKIICNKKHTRGTRVLHGGVHIETVICHLSCFCRTFSHGNTCTHRPARQQGKRMVLKGGHRAASPRPDSACSALSLCIHIWKNNFNPLGYWNILKGKLKKFVLLLLKTMYLFYNKRFIRIFASTKALLILY